MSSRFFRGILRCLFLCCFALGQTNSSAQESDKFVLKPTIGLGAGVLGFSGDIGNQHDEYNPVLSRLAYELRASAPISDAFDASFYVIQGSVGANERSFDRNLNFESTITTGGVMLTYNFGNILGPTRSLEPYISVGIESLEFLSKTDLFDANGNRYHYWSDGTIRSLDENAPNAFMAEQLERDYVFESDIRELDLDGFGSYPERTWALPVGAGIQTNLSGGFDLRFGSSVHYAFTDLIDGVTDESIEGRTGNSQNDFFIYTSFSIGYEINTSGRKRAKQKEDFWSEEMLAKLAETEDEDGDGITDVIDDSPFTPFGVDVTDRGVPVDADGDFVFDHIDQELDSDSGVAVHATGITITDEEFLLAYQIFMDSTGMFASKAYSYAQSTGTVPLRSRPNQRNFVVQVGKEFEGIAPEMVDRILAIPDVRSVDIGDTTFLVVGPYEELPDAIQRQMDLNEMGISSQVREESEDKLIAVSQAELDAGGSSGNSSIENSGSHIIRVQLGAFKYPLSRNIFKDVRDLVILQGDDGLTRYYSGNFKNIEQAADFKVTKLLEGFDGAFLVAFKNGQRVSLSEIGGVLTGPESLDVISSPTLIDKSKISYRILVGEFDGTVPPDQMELFIDLGKVKAIRGKEVIKYVHGKFASREEAEVQLTKVKQFGIEAATLIGDFNGTMITAEEADNLMKQ